MPTTTTPRTRIPRAVLIGLGTALAVVVAVLTTGGVREHPASASASPSREALAATSGARIYFSHQSLGAAILTGMEALYERAGLAPPPVVESSVPPDVAGGYVAHTFGGSGDPASVLRHFRDTVSGPMGDTVSMAILMLSHGDVTADTDLASMFKRYKRTMARLEQERPDVALLYATVPLTADRGLVGRVGAMLGNADAIPADNAARERFNALIRSEYAGTGRLWDIAAIESTGPDGSRAGGHVEQEPYFAIHDHFAADSSHLNDAGSAAAAAALVTLVAEYARA